MSENHANFSANEAEPPLKRKRLGGYLVDAGLLTPAQVDIVLNDQKTTGLRFGEILAARGWVKQQTIEYFMEKVILPEQAIQAEIIEGAKQEEIVNDKQIEGSASTYTDS